ncbi:DUF1642 domain-containing protein [Lactococcus lactis]
MTKFEEEFDNKVEIFDVIGNHNSMCCEVDQVKEADWQPQQALPVVPECVAEWYESHTEDLEFAIYVFCGEFYRDSSRSTRELTDFEKWFDDDENSPIETLIRMKNGYQVEKPQLYRVRLLGGRHTLTRRHPLKTLPFNYTFLWSWSDELKEMREINKEVDLFTEQEIKTIDERYWQFAVPVEDGE